jgi:hypothetical protein
MGKTISSTKIMLNGKVFQITQPLEMNALEWSATIVGPYDTFTQAFHHTFFTQASRL